MSYPRLGNRLSKNILQTRSQEAKERTRRRPRKRKRRTWHPRATSPITPFNKTSRRLLLDPATWHLSTCMLAVEGWGLIHTMEAISEVRNRVHPRLSSDTTMNLSSLLYLDLLSEARSMGISTKWLNTSTSLSLNPNLHLTNQIPLMRTNAVVGDSEWVEEVHFALASNVDLVL